MPSRISAVSYYLPERVYSNEEFFSEFPGAKGTSIEKTGVKERHIVANGQAASDLALLAAEKLFEEHQIDRSTIDFLILSIHEPDYYTPPTSCVLHGKLNLSKKCGAFDYNLGCSGYVYGLAMADGMIRSTGARNVLLLTTSVLTNTFHPKDHSSKFIFGDAGSATLISYSEEEQVGSFIFGTDGKGFDKIIVRDGGARNPISSTSHEEKKDEYGNITSDATFNMNGVSVFLFTMRTVPALIDETLAKAGMKKEEVDFFIFHQPNVFLNETLRKKMNIPAEKFVHCMDRSGNTVQSTIPISIHEWTSQKKIRKGTTALLAGFGVGLSWGATIVKF